MKRSFFLLACFAAALAMGCGDSSTLAGRSPPSIVVVLVDQLRHDAVRRWMPRVDALADRGVRFERMRSAAPWTYPSVISLFSGLYPQQHGANAAHLHGRELAVFDEAVPLLPRALGASYHSAAFVTNPFLHKWNPFYRAFDHYEVDAFIGDQGAISGPAEKVWRRDMFADDVNAKVLEYFDVRPLQGPEFVYVHYIDVHGPWVGAPFEVHNQRLAAIDAARYGTAAHYVDGRIRELYDYFLARYSGEVVFVVTSDHGQELGRDLVIGEGPRFRNRKHSPHDYNTRIPFLILPSRRVPSGVRVDVNCSNVDVAPTLLEWVGADVPAGFPGVSLMPMILGEAAPALFATRATYTINRGFGRSNDAAVIGDRKLIRYFGPDGGVTRAVFDLRRDPREGHLLARRFDPSDAKKLDRVAGTAGIEFRPRDIHGDEQTLENLRNLGYLSGGGDGASGEGELGEGPPGSPAKR